MLNKRLSLRPLKHQKKDEIQVWKKERKKERKKKERKKERKKEKIGLTELKNNAE